jgi:hypothetical protein
MNPYSAAAERATAAQRAAETRKKLSKSASAIEDAAGADEAFLVEKWNGANQGPAPAGQDGPPLSLEAGKESDFG